MRQLFVLVGSLALAAGSLLSIDLQRTDATETEGAPTGAAASHQGQSRGRQPVALAFADEGRQVLVANRHSATISTIDTGSGRIVGEQALGGVLSDLVAVTDAGRLYLAADEAGHRLTLLAREAGGALAIAGQVDVAPYPVSVRMIDDGSRAAVASLWSRQMTIVRLEGGTGNDTATSLKAERTIPLPFAPRCQLWLPAARRLVVADSFVGHLAVVDAGTGAIESVRPLPGHNIRGLALNAAGDRLLVTHQNLSRNARTTFEDLHWGTLLSNVMHSLSLHSILDPQAALLDESRTIRLGDVGRAAGDPAGVAAIGSRGIVVAFAGVGEVAVLQEGKPGQERIGAGIRPTVVAANPFQPGSVCVADSLGDAITIFDVSGEDIRSRAVVALGAGQELTLAERGERLFYDAKLSHDGWMSCHSCHTDGHTSGLLNDNLGDGSFEAPKRILSLLGVGDTAPWAWNGAIESLEAQIRKSVATTMRGPDGTGELSEDQVQALAAYLRTLPPAPPVRSAATEAGAAAATRGAAVFERIGCQQCHTAPSYTSADTYDVGFVDEVGNAHFNPPSLRGVSQRPGLFHDNRAKGLEDALRKFRHQVPRDLSDAELDDLVEFLKGI